MSSPAPRNSKLLSDRIRKEWHLVSGLLMLLTLLFSSLRDDFALGKLNNLIYDFTMAAAIPQAAPPDIVIVAIDDYSIANLGFWPWRRINHAQLLSRLEQARAVGIDLVFQEPNPAYPDDDLALTQAIQQHGRVVLPLVYDPQRYIVHTAIPMLSQAAKASGYINIEPDPDGVVRRVALQRVTPLERVLPHFTIAMLMTGGDMDLALQALDSSKTDIPHIPFLGRSGHFQTVPYFNVLNGDIPASFFKDKYVLVGAWGSGLGDTFPTPLSKAGMSSMSGVEILANTLQAVRSNQWVRTPPAWFIALASCLPVLLACQVLIYLSPRATLLSLIGLVFAILLVNWIAMHGFNLWIPPLASLITVLLAYPLWHWRSQEAALNQVTEELNKLQLEYPDVRTALNERLSGLSARNLPHRLTQLHKSINLLRQAQTKREETLRFISHDMRAPQNSILALASLQRQDDSKLPPDQFLHKMENYAEQTLELVDNFISLARAEAMEMVLSPLALPDLLADCMDDAWASASKRSISLNLHDSELVWVNGNAPMLRRAFTNLIQNAIKYGPDGNQIDIELVLDKKTVRIFVKDQGWGIPIENQATIFEPYHRAHENTAGAPSGSGLGLAFVKTVINKHGGDIALDSTNEQGCTFILSLSTIDVSDEG
ncbi:CHASE2 domain-containing protein [Alcaligenes faecalis]|uniref:CHASE2 domain-containing protein n=1 Tax=Alcaligenes faecalis TaxID=511 RepID=UPI0034D3EA26